MSSVAHPNRHSELVDDIVSSMDAVIAATLDCEGDCPHELTPTQTEMLALALKLTSDEMVEGVESGGTADLAQVARVANMGLKLTSQPAGTLTGQEQAYLLQMNCNLMLLMRLSARPEAWIDTQGGILQADSGKFWNSSNPYRVQVDDLRSMVQVTTRVATGTAAWEMLAGQSFFSRPLFHHVLPPFGQSEPLHAHRRRGTGATHTYTDAHTHTHTHTHTQTHARTHARTHAHAHSHRTAVLCCVVLCCAVLCCVVLCCVVLCCVVLCCVVLCCVVLCCVVLCCVVLCCVVFRC